MRLVMIESVYLEQSPVPPPEPFLASHIVVRHHSMDPRRKFARPEPAKLCCKAIAERQTNVATTHDEQFFDRCARLRSCCKDPRSLTNIAADFLQWPIILRQGLGILLPTFHKEAMH